MFTDVVGSTALITSLGDQRAHVQTREHFAVLRRVLSSFGGHEVKSIGDGLMTTFTSARQAALAAVGMQRAVEREQRLVSSPVRIRIGVNTGEVVEDDGDYFGAAVNIAQRLCDAAEPGQTLLSDVTVALIRNRDGLVLLSAGDFELRGFDEPIHAHEAVAADDQGAGPALPALLQIDDRLPFVGRQRELRLLEDEWRRARAERQRLVTIAGEGGIGKSRLTRHFTASAAPDARHVLHGRCDGEHPVAFEPIVPALSSLVELLPADALAELPARTLPNLSRLLPTLGAQPADAEGSAVEAGEPTDGDPARTRLDLLDAVVAVVGAAGRQGPLLWIIDDLQWADHSTMLVLRRLLTAAATLPVLILATYREHEATGRPAASIVAELRAQSLETAVRLEGLGPGDVQELLSASVGPEQIDSDLAQSLYERTNGHPLFLRELIRALLDDGGGEVDPDQGQIPLGVRSVIERRLEQLGPAVRELLDIAAVTGGRFEVELVARALGGPREAFLALLDAAVVAREIEELPGTPQSCAFSHDLVRETLYGAIPAGRKAELHRRVAGALEEVYAADLNPVVSSLAYHFGVAAVTGTGTAAATYSKRAGDRARQQFAYEEAVEHYQRGLQHVVGADDSRLRGEMLIGLGHALVGVGDTGEARKAFMGAADAARLAAAPDAFARAALGAGFKGATVATADSELIEMLEDAESMLVTGHDALRAQVQTRLARELFSAGDHARADGLSTRALRSAQACDDPLALAAALTARHQCLAGPDRLEERLEIQQRAVALAERAGHHDALLTRLAGLGIDHLRLGDFRAVDEDLARFDALAAQSRPMPLAVWYRTTFEVMRAIVGGRLVEAEALAENGRIAGERAGAPDAAGVHTAQLLGIRREQGLLGDVADVIAAFASDRSIAASNESTDVSWIFLHAQVLAKAGRGDAARATLDGVAPRLDALRRDDFWLLALTLGAEAAVAAEHTGLARRLRATLNPYAGRNVVLGGAANCLGPVDRVLALLAAAGGDAGSAEAHFLAARRISDRMGAAGLQRRIRLEYAAFLTSQGRAEEARVLADDAPTQM